MGINKIVESFIHDASAPFSSNFIFDYIDNR